MSKRIMAAMLLIFWLSISLPAVGEIPSGKPIEWYLENGENNYLNGAFESALGYFKKALELNPRDPVAQKRVAQCQTLLKGTEGERKYATCLLRADNFLKKGDTANALSYYLAALKTLPANEAEVAGKFKAAAGADKTAWALFLEEHPVELQPLINKGLIPAAASSVAQPAAPAPTAAGEKFDFQPIEGVSCERKSGILSASENGIDFKFDMDKKPPIHIAWDAIGKIEGVIYVQKGFKPMAGITIEAQEDKFKFATTTGLDSAFELLEFRYLILEYWQKKINKKSEDEFVLEELDDVEAEAIERDGLDYGDGKITVTKKGVRFSGENEFFVAWRDIKDLMYYGKNYDSYLKILTGEKQGLECQQSGGELFTLGGALNWLWGKYKND